MAFHSLPGFNLHLLLLPNPVRENLLDPGGAADVHPGPLLVHRGLHQLAEQTSPDDHHHDSLQRQTGQEPTKLSPDMS